MFAVEFNRHFGVEEEIDDAPPVRAYLDGLLKAQSDVVGSAENHQGEEETRFRLCGTRPHLLHVGLDLRGDSHTFGTAHSLNKHVGAGGGRRIRFN